LLFTEINTPGGLIVVYARVQLNVIFLLSITKQHKKGNLLLHSKKQIEFQHEAGARTLLK
jgi:hypothetical protein